MTPEQRSRMEEKAEELVNNVHDQQNFLYQIIFAEESKNKDDSIRSVHNIGYRNAFSDPSVVGLVEEIKKIAWINECHCDQVWKDHKRHAPNAICGELDEVINLAAELGMNSAL